MDVLPEHLEDRLIPDRENYARAVITGALLREDNRIPIAGMPSELIAGIVAVATAASLGEPQQD